MSNHYQLWIYRKERNLTAKDMAKVLGVSPNRYLLKEGKKAYFTLDEAHKLAEYFKVTLDELFPNEKESA